MATPNYSASVGVGVQDGGSTTVETAAFTPGGTNRQVLVYVQSSDGSPANVSAVKIGGSGGTALTQVGVFQSFGTFFRSSLWKTTTEPAASSQTIHVTWAGSQGERLVIAVALDTVDIAGTPLGTVAQTSANGSGTAASLSSIGAAVGDLIVDFCGIADTAPLNRTLSANSSQTERIEISTAPAAYDVAAAGTKAATGTSETRAWTLSGGADGWVMFAIAVKGATGGGGGPTGPPTGTLAMMGAGI